MLALLWYLLIISYPPKEKLNFNKLRILKEMEAEETRELAMKQIRQAKRIEYNIFAFYGIMTIITVGCILGIIF